MTENKRASGRAPGDADQPFPERGMAERPVDHPIPFALIDSEADDKEIDDFVAALRSPAEVA